MRSRYRRAATEAIAIRTPCCLSGRNLRIAFGSFGACALRDDTGCNEMPQNLESAISHEEADINNIVCLRSIAEIERGNSNGVFFGRPSYGFGHITAPPANGTMQG